MNYYLDVVDTTSSEQILQEEYATFSGLTLRYDGGDTKAETFLVPSSLSFNMKAPNLSMGYFLHLFTGNEQKYRIDLRKQADDSLIWQGFLLPDTYQEPFTNNNPFISITASDGLGRIKGKYLPDDYYVNEYSVIDIIQQCLLKTGLSFGLYFSAAIEHVSFKKWHTIYLNGKLFVKDEKKQSCYEILEKLVADKLCVVYQHFGYWIVEGVNKRHLVSVIYDEYDVDGSYIGEAVLTRNIKIVDNKLFEAPTVTMVPALKKVNVSYKIEQPKLAENIIQETNTGWSGSVTDIINADAYFPHNGSSFAIASAISDYKVRFQKDYSLSPDTTRFMSLVNPVYVDVGQEVNVDIDFSFSIYASVNYKTSMKVQIALNGVVLRELLLFNDPDIEEEDERTLTAIKEAFNITESGYLDVYFFRPISEGPDRIERDGWEFKSFTVKVVNQSENFLVEDEIADEYTLEKDIELTYTDEFSGLNASFLLEKVNDLGTLTYNQQITIYNEFVSKGKRYIQLNLKDANLCESFPNQLYVGTTNIPVIKVVYNWLGSNTEHMVEVGAPIGVSTADVRYTKYSAGSLDRSTWQSWTDAIYRIENERFGKIIANIYRRMFLEPYERIDGTANALITYHDMVVFTYVNLRRYVPLSLSMVLDTGKTDLSMVLNYYHDNSGGVSTNISPILNIMPDFVIDEDTHTVSLTAEAYDPDGFIVTYEWVLISGDLDASIVSPDVINTDVSGLNGDVYVFQLTVTDNGGASVSDTVTVTRIVSADVSANYSCGYVLASESTPPLPTGIGTTYRKGVLFELPSGMLADYNFNVKLKIDGIICTTMAMDAALDDLCSNTYTISDSRLWRMYGAGIRVFKNGLSAGSYQLYHPSNLAAGFVNFSMNSSDTILIMIYGYSSTTDSTKMNTKVTVEEITEINGEINISNEGLEFYLTTTYTV